MERPYDIELAYFRSLLTESDRGCVLLVAARLDELLEGLHRTQIRSVAKPSSGFLDKLFSAHAPLSTFASRIQLAYAFGLLSHDDYVDFEELRKLRNLAAHGVSEFKLTEQSVKDAIMRIKAPARVSQALFPVSKAAPVELNSQNKDDQSLKLYFLMTCMSLSIVILSKATSILERR